MNIGDTVEVIPNRRYTMTTGGQRGTIIDFGKGYAFVVWDEVTCKQLDIKSSRFGWEIELKYLKLTQPAIQETTEQKVSRKCKLLWNQSNYVKKNPQYAY